LKIYYLLWETCGLHYLTGSTEPFFVWVVVVDFYEPLAYIDSEVDGCG